MPKWAVNLLAAGVILGLGHAAAAPLTPGLIRDLRHGGYVLLMRHASSPPDLPSMSIADPLNVKRERQLDETGRTTATAMGQAIKALHIPLGTILASPTYRALETVRLAGLGTRDCGQLGDQGQSMARIAGPGPITWLQDKVAQRPPAGQNSLIVTHMPNIVAAFPTAASGLQDGELRFQTRWAWPCPADREGIDNGVACRCIRSETALKTVLAARGGPFSAAQCTVASRPDFGISSGSCPAPNPLVRSRKLASCWRAAKSRLPSRSPNPS